ncbi:MAG: glycosyltransferase family 2 protein [Sandaracinaceae bacterium]|nr:glycosyltransferase family 2 protein [Sandaracinaceae bacterium]
MVNLSVVIPSYNGRDVLRRALRNLRAEVPEAEVVVVDGRSSDGSGDMVAAEFPEVRLHEFPNFGWGHATNRGLSLSRGQHLLLLNSDVFVTRAAILAMRDRLAGDRAVGAVGPVLVDEEGRREKVFGRINLRNYVPARSVERVGLLSGACLMTRRDVLAQVGAIDEHFHFYNDDTEWCLRTRRAGFRLERVPQRVVHVGGASTPSSPLYTLEAHRGFLYMMSKHFPPHYAEVVRRAMWVRGFVNARVDPRPMHRDMWARLESITLSGDYLDCPFPLSGRGVTAIPTSPPANGRDEAAILEVLDVAE